MLWSRKDFLTLLKKKEFFNLPFVFPWLIMQVKTVVFDKTGTLTVGKPEVVSAVPFSGYSMEEFCDLATAAEVGV